MMSMSVPAALLMIDKAPAAELTTPSVRRAQRP
jgi:hypothetical protein